MQWRLSRDNETGIVYRRMGDGGRGVVLLHGWPETGEAWRDVAQVLSSQFTVVVPDLPGYGQSAFAGGDGGKQVVASVLARFVERLGFEEVRVAGHDRGGRVAHRWALDRPDQVPAVALLDIVPMDAMLAHLGPAEAHRAWHWFFNASAEAEDIIARDVRGYIGQVLEGPRTAGVIDESRVQHYLDAYGTRGAVKGFLADYRAALHGYLELERSELRMGVRAEQPVLVMTGNRGPVAGVNVGSVWNRYARNVQTHDLDAGHYLPEERPLEVARLLAQFFAAPH